MRSKDDIQKLIHSWRKAYKAGIMPKWKSEAISQIPGWDWTPERIHKPVEQLVSDAEALCKENRGILPSTFWLCKNGYSALYLAIRKFPDMFRHINRKKRKSPIEWLNVAKVLASKNGGILPCYQWLYNHGYNGLVHAIRDRPDLFQDIQVEKIFKSQEEWINIASKLSIQNGGFLETQSWLNKNGYSSLMNKIFRHPELFRHFPRVIRSRGGNISRFRNGTISQRRALDKKHGLPPGTSA